MTTDTATTEVTAGQVIETLTVKPFMYLGSPVLGGAILAYADVSGFWGYVMWANLLLWTAVCILTPSALIEGEREQGFLHRRAAIDYALKWRFSGGFFIFLLAYMTFDGFLFTLFG